MAQTPLLGVAASPTIPITGSTIGSDPTTTGSPGGNTTVEADLTELYALVAAAAIEVDDEGTPLTAAVTSLDFVGAGVTATAVGDAVTVTIDGSGGMTPYYIAAGDTFTVPLYRQALFSEAIEVDGGLVVNGLLIGVD